MAEEVGTYVLPVILSFDGVEKQANSKLSKVFGDVGKKASKDLGDGARAAAADVDKLAASYSKLKDKAADALGKVRADEAALQRLRDTGASDDRIIRAEERLATSRRNSARANRDAETGLRDLNRAQSDLGDGSNRTSGILKGLGGAAAAMGAVAGGAALAGVAALSAGVAVAGKQLYDLGSQFDDLSDSLTIKTGATGEALEALQSSVERLGTSNVPLSFAEIGDVAADVTRNLHLTGKPLEDLTSRLSNLNRMTGEQVDIKALGKAFRGFGVDVEDQVPALNQLFGISQRTGLSVNELTGSIGKAGAPLREIGMSFGESAALVAQLNEAGLDADAMLKGGLTKSLAAMAKDGQTGAQALQDNVAQIKAMIDAGDTAGAQNLSNKLFGAKGGLQFFEVIKNGDLDLQSLSASLQTTSTDINDVAANTADWEERWQTFKNTAAVALEPLGTATFEGVNGMLTSLADQVTAHQPEIIGFFTSLADAAVTGAEVGIRSVGLLSEGFGQLIAPIGDVLGAMNKFQALQADFRGDHEQAEALRAEAEGFFSWGEGLTAFGREAKNFDASKIRDQVHEFSEQAINAATVTRDLGQAVTLLPDGKTIVLTDNTPEAIARIDATKYSIEQIPGTKDFRVIPKTEEATTQVNSWLAQQTGKKVEPVVDPNLGPANQKMEQFMAQWSTAIGAIRPPAGAPPAPGQTTPGNPLTLPFQGPRANGGPLTGNGTKGVDSMLFAGAPGEHVFAADEVDALGGQQGAYRLRRLIKAGVFQGFADGGAIEAGIQRAASIDGLPYVYGGVGPDGFDCSGAQSAVYAAFTGKSPSQRHFTTESDFEALGFQKGYMPGAYNIGVRRGGGGKLSHMGATLPNGVNFEAGGANNGVAYGDGARGAEDFPLQWYLPLAGGDPFGAASGGFGSTSAASGSSGGSGGGGGGGTAGIGPNGESGTYSVDQADVADKQARVAEADARIREAEAKQRELEVDAKESEKIRAQADIDKARADAEQARGELAQAKQGKFTPGKSSSSPGGGAGGPQLSELGGIFGSFLKETTGLDGSWLPDIGSFAPMQMVDTLLGAFMPGGGSEGAAGPSTSSAPFGLPDMSAPPLPPPGVHTGSGAAPGPNVTNHFDLSNKYQGTVGMDPEALAKQNERSQARGVARLNSFPMGIR